MQSRDFCYWLQGFFEIADASHEKPIGLTGKQVDMVKAHLNMVFKHEIDPSMGDEEQLNKIHDQIFCSDPNVGKPRC